MFVLFMLLFFTLEYVREYIFICFNRYLKQVAETPDSVDVATAGTSLSAQSVFLPTMGSL
jgi:hypothetical protein